MKQYLHAKDGPTKANASLVGRHSASTANQLRPPTLQLQASSAHKKAPPLSPKKTVEGMKPELLQKDPDLKPDYTAYLLMILSLWRTNYPSYLKEFTSEIISQFGEFGKEMVIRSDLFAAFEEEEGLSVVDPKSVSGMTAKGYSDNKKQSANMTSCIMIQQSILKKVFEKNAGIDIKETHRYDWDGDKNQVIKSRGKSTSYDFYSMMKPRDIGAWRPAKAGMAERPKPGDMYLLSSVSTGYQSHIGYVKYIEKINDTYEIWHTFDGGQPVGAAIQSKEKGAQAYKPDGSRSNERLYNVKTNIIQIDGKKIKELRNPSSSSDKDELEPATSKAPKIYQDGKPKKVMGWIDIGALIQQTVTTEAPDIGEE